MSKSSAALTVTISGSTVVGHYVYYPDSILGNKIASEPQVFVPTTELVAATFKNVTNHPDGIRGIYIDVTNLPAEPTNEDVLFRTGNSDDPSGWQFLMTTPEISVIRGGGTDNSDRIVLTWPAHTIENTWLQVTLKAELTTGLTEQDVCYLGNRVGDVGDEASPGMVTAADLVAIRNHPCGPSNPAGIDNRYDINKDKMVDVLDLILARNNVGSPLDALRMITPPVNPGPSPTPMGIVEAEGMPPTPPDGVDTGWEKPWEKRSSDADPLLIDLVLGASI